MPAENLLFLREAELIVGPKFGGKNIPVEPLNGRLFRTRLNFEIDRTGGSEANKAKISIYNLSESSRTFLEQKDLVVFLKAGYKDGGLSTLFFGDIDDKNGLRVKRVGPDIITTIEAGDVEKTLREANIQIGLSKGSTNIQIINQAAAKLLVSTAFRTNIKTITFQKGFSYSGPVKDLIDQMGSQAGFEWTIQNGELLILDPLQTDQQEAVFLSVDTGLIGYPTKTQDKIEFKSLLNPKIIPGRAVRIESKIFSNQGGATLKVTKAKIKGDTDNGPWEVMAEGLAI